MLASCNAIAQQRLLVVDLGIVDLGNCASARTRIVSRSTTVIVKVEDKGSGRAVFSGFWDILCFARRILDTWQCRKMIRLLLEMLSSQPSRGVRIDPIKSGIPLPLQHALVGS